MKRIQLPKRMWAVVTPEYLDDPRCGVDLYRTRRTARYYAHPRIDRVVKVETKVVKGR